MAEEELIAKIYQGDKVIGTGKNAVPIHVDLAPGKYAKGDLKGEISDSSGTVLGSVAIDEFTILNLPGAASVALEAGDGKATFTVTRPEDDGGKDNDTDDITAIQVEYKAASDGWDKSTKLDVDLKTLKGTITGLVNGTEYTVRTITTNSYGSTTAGDDLAQHVTPKAALVAVTKVAIDPATASVEVGKTVTLKEVITPDNTTEKGVNWSIADTSVATVSGGVVTGKAAGKTTLTATSKADSKITGTAEITVTAPAAG